MCWCRLVAGSLRPIARASYTVTSNPTTFCSATTAAFASSTSGWLRRPDSFVVSPRVAYTFNRDPDRAPVLCISYTFATGTPGRPSAPGSGGASQAVVRARISSGAALEKAFISKSPGVVWQH